MRSVRFFFFAVALSLVLQTAYAFGPVIRKATTATKAAAATKGVKTKAVTTARLQPLRVTPPVDIMHDHSPVTVTGGVTGADGMPLPGATVWLTNTHQAVAVTNSAGDFTFTLPNNATVSLTCGYGNDGEQTIVVSPNKRDGIFFKLPVTASRRRR